ncbi:MAG: SEL1-like repeat protein [Alphaproteobacteria bacterium]|nr:SEL1-like repeat protein [Alphaproteobacteria bacterium]
MANPDRPYGKMRRQPLLALLALAGAWLAALPLGAQPAPQPPVTQLGSAAIIYTFRGIQTSDITWVRQAAEQGFPAAQMALARHYRLGNGVERDLALQSAWLSRAAEKQFPWAAYELGRVYETGEGVLADDAIARNWYRRAANLELIPAMKRLAELKDGEDGGQAWKKRYDLAAALDVKYIGLLKSIQASQISDEAAYAELAVLSQAGHRRAGLDMALRQISGRGTAKNVEAGLNKLEESEKSGHAAASLHLGELFLAGKEIERDTNRAVTHLRKAVEGNQVKAMTLLGRLYELGSGLAQDMDSALMLYRMAGEQGESSAQYRLGYLAEQGNAMPKDMDKAQAWYKLAAQGNNQNAKDALRRLGVSLPATAGATAAPDGAAPASSLKSKALSLSVDSVCKGLSGEERSLVEASFKEEAAKLGKSADGLLGEARSAAAGKSCDEQAAKIMRAGLAATLRPRYQEFKAKDAEAKIWASLMPAQLINRRCRFFGAEAASQLDRFASQLDQRIQSRVKSDPAMSTAIGMAEEEFANMANKSACDAKARQQVEGALKFANGAAKKGAKEY